MAALAEGVGRVTKIIDHSDPRLGMSERQLQDLVVQAAKYLGYLVYHTYDSRRSAPGFPDLVMVHPAGGMLWRELKATKGRLTPEQEQWLTTLNAAGQDAGVWRPADWASGLIQRELSEKRGVQ